MSSMQKFFNSSMKDAQVRMLNLKWEEPSFYADWLAQTYYYVCHSTRLLALSAARFDRAHNQFHLRAIEHMREEKSHEELAQRDIRALKFSLDDFPEAIKTAAFYQSQYYFIDYVNPIALYGYILFLEGIAIYVGKDLYAKVVSAYGEKAASFLKLHSEEDEDHLAKAFQVLETSTPEEKAAVLKSFEESKGLYLDMLEDLSRAHPETRFQAAG